MGWYFLFGYFHVRFPVNLVLACVFWKWFDWNISALTVERHHGAVLGVTFASVWIIRDIIVLGVSTLDPVILLGSRRVKKSLLRDSDKPTRCVIWNISPYLNKLAIVSSIMIQGISHSCCVLRDIYTHRRVICQG